MVRVLENDVHSRSIYFETKISVEIQSGGNIIKTGLDADNKNISVELIGVQCNITFLGLTSGKSLITLTACQKGTAVTAAELVVRVVTYDGVVLKVNTSLQFTDDLNVILFSPPNINKHVGGSLLGTTNNDVVGSTKMRLHHGEGAFYLATGQSHLFFYVDASINDVIFDKYTEAENIPSIAIQHHSQHQQEFSDENIFHGFNKTMFLSSPHNSNFHSVLLDEQVKKSSRIVLIRTKDSISYSDLYACLLYTSPSPRDATLSRMPSSA